MPTDCIRLTLVRHAEHDFVGTTLVGRGDPGLSPAGRSQAAALAEALPFPTGTHVWSSPRRRCRETAAPIAARLRVSAAIAPELDEIDYGGWTGRTFSSLTDDPAWTRWNGARASARPPSGETMQEALQRVRRLLLPLDGARHVLVTHAELIRALVLQARGWSFDDWHRVEIAPASATLLDLRQGRLTEREETRC